MPTYVNYLNVPRVYAQDLSFWRDLLRTGQGRTLNLAFLGDSQETSPGGQGKVYIPNLAYNFYLLYGHSPATAYAGVTKFYDNQPRMEWLIAGLNDPTVAATRLNADQLLPGLAGTAKAVTQSDDGIFISLIPDCTYIYNDAGPPENLQGFPIGTVNYMRTKPEGDEVYAEIIAATNASSGGVEYTTRPLANIGDALNKSAADTGWVQDPNLTASVLQDPVFAVHKSLIGPLDFGSGNAVQLQVRGTDPVTPTDIICARFVNRDAPEGVAIDAFAFGGADTRDWYTDHADVGLTLAAMKHDAYVLHFGANDAARSSPQNQPAKFQEETETLIGILRGWVGPAAPVMIVVDPPIDVTFGTADRRTQFKLYASAAFEVAKSDPRVLVVNTRRIVEEDLGWDENNTITGGYSTDGIHLIGLGAREYAKATVDELTSEVFNFGDSAMSRYDRVADAKNPTMRVKCDEASGNLFDGVEGLEFTVLPLDVDPLTYREPAEVPSDRTGYSVTFPDDRVRIINIPGNDNVLVPTTHTQTVEFWCTPTLRVGSSLGIYGRRLSDSSEFCGFFIEEDGSVGCRWSGATTINISQYTQPGVVVSGKNYYIAITVDDATGEMKARVNENVYTMSPGPTGPRPGTADRVSVGGMIGTDFFKGGFDELRTYGQVLSESETLENYLAGLPLGKRNRTAPGSTKRIQSFG